MEIGRIRKNKMAEIVVKTSAFKGYQLCDIREYVTSDEYEGYTKKGITIHKKNIKELISLLEEAKESPDEKSEEEEE